MIKHIVSKKRRRYIENGFDLDLAYIKPNIIAMGFPSENLEGVYRNSFDDVVRFLEQKHKDKYKVYNLCSEKYYEPEKFCSRVSLFGFDDHSAPLFELMEQCCVDMDNWLNKDVDNVAIVHCKTGKGRTGVMICAYLLYRGYFDNAKDAVDYYAKTRTYNEKGVTIPSQRRYIEYFSYYMKNINNGANVTFDRKTVLLESIKFIGIPTFNSGTCVPSFVIYSGKVELYKSKQTFEIKKNDKEYTMKLQKPVPLCGDIKIDFFHKELFKKERMFVFWFNTSFLEYNTTSSHTSSPGCNKWQKNEVKSFLFSKKELDKANKDKKDKFFPSTFQLSLDITLPGDGKTDATDSCEQTSQNDNKCKSNVSKIEKSSSSESNEKLAKYDEIPKTNSKQTSDKANRTLSPFTKRGNSTPSAVSDLNRSSSPSLDTLAVEDVITVEDEQLSDDDEEEEFNEIESK